MPAMKRPIPAFLAFSVLLAGCDIIIEDPFLFDERDLLTGNYEVEEYSETEGATFVYDLSIYKSRHHYNIIILYNLYDSDLEVIAEVYEYGKKIRIPQQRIGDLEFEGAGTLYNDEELSITYTVRNMSNNPLFADFVSAIAWKY